MSDEQAQEQQVTRSVDVEADAAVVWDAIADPERRSQWLDDDDAVRREMRIDSVDTGRSLSWTWWDPDRADHTSRVEIVLTELAGGGTRVAVTERLVGRPSASTLTARASVAPPSTWDRRLLGLELLLLAAAVCVG